MRDAVRSLASVQGLLLPPHPHLSRLGVGLLVIGAAEVVHHLWGLTVDVPLLIAGGVGLVSFWSCGFVIWRVWFALSACRASWHQAKRP
jgi:hypothetical protein